jgi:transposase InsO family protein
MPQTNQVNENKAPAAFAAPAAVKKRQDRQQQIALLRYGLVAPVLNLDGQSQMDYFRQLSAKAFDVPGLGTKHFKVSTLKKWLHLYRSGGFEALLPHTRSDHGSFRRIDEQLGAVIREKLEQFPWLSATGIYRILQKEGYFQKQSLAESTLRHWLARHRSSEQLASKIPRKKFEKPHVNELWVTDFMHGPCVHNGSRRCKSYLCAIIDDHSRLIVGSGFFLAENTHALLCVVKQALLTYGLPKALYCDNGKVFSTHYLQLACARLGFALVHSKPYDSPSRGKIERFFRTVRDKFLAALNTDTLYGLDALNDPFKSWLDQDYLRSHHSGIDMRPIDKYLADLKQTSLSKISEHELDQLLLCSIVRTVRNDACVSIDKVYYEVPPQFIGQQVDIRFPLDKPDQLSLFASDKPFCRLRKVDPHANATDPTWSIRFSDAKKEESES